MIHLTFTGSCAGLTYCGIPVHKRAEFAPGATYAHGIYAPLADAAYRAQVCPDCLALWDMPDEPDPV